MKTINTKSFIKVSQTTPAPNTAAGIAGAFNQMGAGVKENAAAKIQEYVDRIEKGESYDSIMGGLANQPDMRAKIDQAIRNRYPGTPDQQKNWAIPIDRSNVAAPTNPAPATVPVPNVPVPPNKKPGIPLGNAFK